MQMGHVFSVNRTFHWFCHNVEETTSSDVSTKPKAIHVPNVMRLLLWVVNIVMLMIVGFSTTMDVFLVNVGIIWLPKEIVNPLLQGVSDTRKDFVKTVFRTISSKEEFAKFKVVRNTREITANDVEISMIWSMVSVISRTVLTGSMISVLPVSRAMRSRMVFVWRLLRCIANDRFSPFFYDISKFVYFHNWIFDL